MRSKLIGLGILAFAGGCRSHGGFNDDGTPDASDGGTSNHPKSDSGIVKSDGGATLDSGSTNTVPALEMISGNGGIVPSQWPATDPVVVRATDAQGNPVANTTVTFTPTSSLHVQALSGNGTVVTDSNGIASTTYNAFGIDQNLGHELDTITASWNGLQV